MRLGAQFGTSRRHHLGSLDLDIHGARAALDCLRKDAQLIVDTPVELPVILVPPAGGKDRAVWIFSQERSDRFRAKRGIGQIVDPEFEEVLACLGLASRLFKQPGNVGQSERDADLRKRAPLCHSVHQNTTRDSEVGARPGTIVLQFHLLFAYDRFKWP